MQTSWGVDALLHPIHSTDGCTGLLETNPPSIAKGARVCVCVVCVRGSRPRHRRLLFASLKLVASSTWPVSLARPDLTSPISPTMASHAAL